MRPLAAAVPLTSYQGREWHPALSPDGTRVAFVRRLPGSDHSDLFIKQRDSEAALQLTEGPGGPPGRPGRPTVSRSPSCAGKPGSRFCARFLAWVARSAGCRWWHPLSTGWIGRLMGRHLVYSALAEDSGEHRLFQLSLEDLPVRTPACARKMIIAGDFQPRYSPDGHQLAWMSLAQDGTGHLYVGSPDGAGPAGQAWPGRGAGPGLVRRWKFPGLCGILGGAFSLWQVGLGAAGGPIQAARWLPTQEILPGIPPLPAQTGDLAYEQVRVDQDLWRVRVLSRNPWQLETAPFIQSTRWEYEARLQPRWPAGGPGFGPIGYAGDLAGRRRGRGPSAADPPAGWRGLANLRWSPDGQQLAFNAVQEGAR